MAGFLGIAARFRGGFWLFFVFFGLFWGVEIGFVFSGSETKSLALLDVSAGPIVFYRLALFFPFAKRFGAWGGKRGKGIVLGVKF